MKRRLTLITIFLILGAVVNVGLVWSSPLFAPVNGLVVINQIPKIPPGNDWPAIVPDDWPQPEFFLKNRFRWDETEAFWDGDSIRYFQGKSSLVPKLKYTAGVRRRGWRRNFGIR